MLPDSDHSPQLVELKYTMSQISGLARRLVSEHGMGGDSRLSTEGQDEGVANWDLINDASVAMAQQTSGSDDGDGTEQQRGTSGVMKPRKLGGAAHGNPVSHESVWAGDVLGVLIRLGAEVGSGLRMVLERHHVRGAQGTTEAAAAASGEGGSPPPQPSQKAASPLASLSQASPPGSSTSSAIKVRAPPMFLV